MLHIATTSQQIRDTEIDLEDLQMFMQEQIVSEPCERFRTTESLNDKKKIPVILLSGPHFFIDFDGKSHKDGNQEDLDFELIASQINHAGWFPSPSGTGVKFLIEVNRDPKPGERAAITFYLREKIAGTTGLKVDGGRSDIAFLSDFPLHISGGVFEIPDEFPKKRARSERKLGSECYGTSDDLHRLADILNNYRNESDYNDWLALVIAALVRYGDDAIPLLQEKWETDVPYPVIQQWAIANECNADMLDYLWSTRIEKDDCFDPEGKYTRSVITGPTGSGKSEFAFNEIASKYEEPEEVYSSYVVFVASSVAQAIDFSKRLHEKGISFEILASKAKYMEVDPDTQKKLTITSSNDTAVKIVQLASLKNGGYYRHIKSEHRRLEHLYIDELVFHDFARPSLLKPAVSRATTGVSVDGDLKSHYIKTFTDADLKHAEDLQAINSRSHFVSSLLFQAANTTVLSTEEFTVHCLVELGYEKTVLKKEETKALKDKHTLHVAVSDDFIVEFGQSMHFDLLKKEHGFTNVFANNSVYANENLVSSKGKEILGKNLVVIRNLPPEAVEQIEELYASCFKDTAIDPVGLFYRDQMMQAAGRSIGFRGGNEVWVMVHTRVWDRIKHLDYIYTIKNWDLELSPEFKEELREIRRKKRYESGERDKQKAIRWQKEKEAKIRTHLINTGKPEDKITKKMLKQKFGNGFTLADVEDTFGVKRKRTNSGRYIDGFKIAA
jgi:hypothetical protein